MSEAHAMAIADVFSSPQIAQATLAPVGVAIDSPSVKTFRGIPTTLALSSSSDLSDFAAPFPPLEASIGFAGEFEEREGGV